MSTRIFHLFCVRAVYIYKAWGGSLRVGGMPPPTYAYATPMHQPQPIIMYGAMCWYCYTYTVVRVQQYVYNVSLRGGFDHIIPAPHPPVRSHPES